MFALYNCTKMLKEKCDKLRGPENFYDCLKNVSLWVARMTHPNQGLMLWKAKLQGKLN